MPDLARLLRVLLACSVITAPAAADYQSIQHNLLDDASDTFFDGPTGGLSMHAASNNPLTLNDPWPLFGQTTNVVFDMHTTLVSVLPGNQARFRGGTISLTFDFDDGSGFRSREIAGPIWDLRFSVTPVGNHWKVDGSGDWIATTINLPGSGVWPDGGGYSSVDSLSIVVDDDLDQFDWDRTMIGRIESTYTLDRHQSKRSVRR